MSISFPDKQFTQTWRNTLLADLKKRIQQVKETPGSLGWWPEQRESLVLCLGQKHMETQWLGP